MVRLGARVALIAVVPPQWPQLSTANSHRFFAGQLVGGLVSIGKQTARTINDGGTPKWFAVLPWYLGVPHYDSKWLILDGKK